MAETNLADLWSLTVVTMKGMVFWFVTPCSSEKSRRFGGTYCLRRIFLLGSLFKPEYGGDMFLRNVKLFPNYNSITTQKTVFERNVAFQTSQDEGQGTEQY
jgi:hypothetical protein